MYMVHDPNQTHTCTCISRLLLYIWVYSHVCICAANIAFYLPVRSSLGLLKSKLEKYQKEMGDEKEKEMKLEQDLRDKE